MDAPPPPIPTNPPPVISNRPVVVKSSTPAELQLNFLKENLPFGNVIYEVVSASLLAQQGNLSRTYRLQLKYTMMLPRIYLTHFASNYIPQK